LFFSFRRNRNSLWKRIFSAAGRLIPPAFSGISETQRPSACVSESVTKAGGPPAAFKNCFQRLFQATASLKEQIYPPFSRTFGEKSLTVFSVTPFNHLPNMG
jgi:hypothetical protein